MTSQPAHRIPEVSSQRVCVAGVVQAPCGLVLIAGSPVQTLLPTTLNSQNTGAIEETQKRSVLRVRFMQTSETIVWWLRR